MSGAPHGTNHAAHIVRMIEDGKMINYERKVLQECLLMFTTRDLRLMTCV